MENDRGCTLEGEVLSNALSHMPRTTAPEITHDRFSGSTDEQVASLPHVNNAKQSLEPQSVKIETSIFITGDIHEQLRYILCILRFS
ncbi:hypothetical protein KIN20_011758 [Parelaphostrongylus tenuis]|uniref:Uncharacterized protein n=1 Tax=Parelaphostrongylus tenuis TaxID=148309 RepID=A0AAD5QMA4_PARTN|nr:hypothetical protein KIN20_011758 [Parelaphostrongylus tenuis]